MNYTVEWMLCDHIYGHVAALAVCAHQRIELFGQDLWVHMCRWKAGGRDDASSLEESLCEDEVRAEKNKEEW